MNERTVSLRGGRGCTNCEHVGGGAKCLLNPETRPLPDRRHCGHWRGDEGVRCDGCKHWCSDACPRATTRFAGDYRLDAGQCYPSAYAFACERWESRAENRDSNDAGKPKAQSGEEG